MNRKGFYLNSKDEPEKEEKKGAQSEPSFIMKEPSYVEEVDNHIYFYGEIGRSEILRLNRVLRQKSIDLFNTSQVQSNTPANVFLHINSYGGEIFAGFSAMDEIINCRVPVCTIIDGCCASAATFLSVVGKRRLIHRHGFMLIHQLSGFMWGKYKEMEDEKKNLDRLMAMIKDIYKEFTEVPEGELDEILDHDLWFDAEKCLKYKMVDEII